MRILLTAIQDVCQISRQDFRVRTSRNTLSFLRIFRQARKPFLRQFFLPLLKNNFLRLRLRLSHRPELKTPRKFLNLFLILRQFNIPRSRIPRPENILRHPLILVLFARTAYQRRPIDWDKTLYIFVSGSFVLHDS